MQSSSKHWSDFIPSISGFLSVIILCGTTIITINQYQIGVREKEREYIRSTLNEIFLIGQKKDFVLSKAIYTIRDVETILSDEDQYFLGLQIYTMFLNDYKISSKKHADFLDFSLIESRSFQRYLKANDYQMLLFGQFIGENIMDIYQSAKDENLENYGGMLIERKDRRQIEQRKLVKEYFPRAEILDSLIGSSCFLFNMMKGTEHYVPLGNLYSFYFDGFNIKGEKIFEFAHGEVQRCGFYKRK
ncbi:hypothetical protein LEP1GSC013_4513 [Leptospira interrogans serovar Valbuzzi str. Duyster]|uniref:hypothetical protein n=1 Tax=Leptospira interrogans TaxID=173 RepID=UPI0002BBAA2B|nr:hypothetical protein [Leptospira interrogans]EMJ57204.1 hypothetical protein LEP1GSC013_4513 [Leptospira interrogans serovar Valbuzzi str. Duyster]ENO73546.1 hypothetical protein LEP1GSC012_1707 [Leptospira interrogans serovar Valbuzzi str. Valbuzzi]